MNCNLDSIRIIQKFFACNETGKCSKGNNQPKRAQSPVITAKKSSTYRNAQKNYQGVLAFDRAKARIDWKSAIRNFTISAKDMAVYNDWQAQSGNMKIQEKNILKQICEFLESYENKFGYNFSETKKVLTKNITK